MNVVQSGSATDDVSSLLENTDWCLVTSSGWLGRGLLERFRVPPDDVIIVPTHPDIEWVSGISAQTTEFVVAIGGGSVIDGAKAVVAGGSTTSQSYIKKMDIVAQRCNRFC